MTVGSGFSGADLWAIVPAAGVGARMASNRPKQYLPLAGQTVIEHTLARLLDYSPINTIYVGVSQDDAYWRDLAVSREARVCSFTGGNERADTVLNGLLALLDDGALSSDWVLVHDAARPCVRTEDIALLTELVVRDLGAQNPVTQNPVGGILATPVADTLKRAAGNQQIDTTVDRTGLWRALTPQLFQIGLLHDALQSALSKGYPVTDEASAMEFAGHKPRLVAGHTDNIKVTLPEDLSLASLIIQARSAS